MSDTATQALLVPVKVQAFYASEPTTIAKQRLDMRGAQYFDGKDSQPQDAPVNLSDKFLTQDYTKDSSQISLPAGLYLHWSVTDALATMRQSPLDDGQMVFPEVPNRWMVTRSSNGSVDAQWVIESDRLLTPALGGSEDTGPPPPPGAPPPPVSSSSDSSLNPQSHDSDPRTQFPIPLRLEQDKLQATIDNARNNQTPLFQYRFIGNQTDYDSWTSTPAEGAEYLTQHLPHGLTVTGYGEPTFASIFSNCTTVFGFRDDSADFDPSKTYRYDVLGWYSQPGRDCLRNFVLEPDLTSDSERFQALLNEYGWQADSEGVFPARSAYYAAVSLTPDTIDESATSSTDLSVSLAVANTPNEALSAYLANQIDPQNKRLVEDQLEALGLASRLKGKPFLALSDFEKLRHGRGFKSVQAGTLWALTPEETGEVQKAAQKSQSLPALPPAEWEQKLDLVNKLQQAYDTAHMELQGLRAQVFADWYKYEQNFYADPISECWGCFDYQSNLNQYQLGEANDDSINQRLPELNDISSYMDAGIKDVFQRLAAVGTLRFNQAQGIFEEVPLKLSAGVRNYFATDTEFLDSLDRLQESSLASRWLKAYNSLGQALTSFNQDNPDVPWSLTPQSAPRFWQSTDPAVFIEAGNEKSLPPLTSLYGSDGILACSTTTVDADPSAAWSKTEIQQLQTAVFAVVPQGSEPIADAPVRESVMMEWSATVNGVLPAATQDGYSDAVISGTQLNPYGAGVDFQPDYLDENFCLPEEAVDLRLPANPQLGPDSTFRNSVILSSYANSHLNSRLVDYLKNITLLELKNLFFGREGGVTTDFPNSDLAAWNASGPSQTPAPDSTGYSDSDWDQWLAQQYPFQLADGSFAGTAQAAESGWGAEALESWYQSPENPVYDQQTSVYDPVNTSLVALALLPSVGGMSQLLGGFNDALLMKEQVIQLPIFDLNMILTDFTGAPPPPGGSNPYTHFDRLQAFAEAVGHFNQAAPNSNGSFLPWRSGALTVTELTLVDSFGRVTPLSVSSQTYGNAVNFESFLPPGTTPDGELEEQAFLPPRLAQPAQLSFRWFSAGNDDIEVNSHFNSSPICGWVLPNNLDASLSVFDGQGNALGSINSSAEWEAAPGSSPRMSAAQIENPHLKNFVTGLTVNSPSDLHRAPVLSNYIANFLSTLDSSAARVEPESFAQHESLALLIGRPLALVRARIELRLQGMIELNQSYAAYIATIYAGREARNLSLMPGIPSPSNQYEFVRVPVKLGDTRSHNDGLIGFWNDSELAEGIRTFYAPKVDTGLLDPNVVGNGTVEGRPMICPIGSTQNPSNVFHLAPYGTACDVTMLVDPRAPVTAVSGILPTKSIDIPSYLYAQFLKRLAVTFLTTPLLTDATQLTVPVPNQPGFQWAWVSKASASDWQTQSLSEGQGPVAVPTENPKFTPQKITEGWLKMTLNPSGLESN